MKITIKSGDKTQVHKISVELSDGSDIDEVLLHIKRLLVGYGFQPDSVDEGFSEFEPFYKEEEE